MLFFLQFLSPLGNLAAATFPLLSIIQDRRLQMNRRTFITEMFFFFWLFALPENVVGLRYLKVNNTFLNYISKKNDSIE